MEEFYATISFNDEDVKFTQNSLSKEVLQTLFPLLLSAPDFILKIGQDTKETVFSKNGAFTLEKGGKYVVSSPLHASFDVVLEKILGKTTTLTVDFSGRSGYGKTPSDTFSPSGAQRRIRESLSFYQENQKEWEEQMKDFRELQIACLVYFSNLIESAGLQKGETFKLVQGVLRQEKKVTDKDLESERKPQKNQRSRREVVQHAMAYQYLCVENLKELTVGIVLKTHSILMEGIDTREDGGTITAGQFRKDGISVGALQCPSWKLVPDLLESLLQNLKKDTRDDAILVAAQLSYRFSLIHPFDDGNGRMSRLLLNWVLLNRGSPFPCIIGFGIPSKGKKTPKRRYFNALENDNGVPTQTGNFLATLILRSMENQWAKFRAIPHLTSVLSEF